MLTPSPIRCATCVASAPLQVIRFPHAAPASPPAAASPPRTAWLPYDEALPTQRYQTMVLARQVIQAAYPFLEEAQWVQALEELRLPLCLYEGEVTLQRDRLTTLVEYLAACYPTVPAADIFASPVPLPDDEAQDSRNQTFSISVGVALQLKRVSYWKRVPVGWLVNQALALLLRQYPEAWKPTPRE
jgi:hypothetical protein